jgi:glycosyltransferase involved in cell wall biosynthesis
MNEVQKIRIALLVPAYNCAGQITETLTRLREGRLDIDSLWVMDNQSLDRTLEVSVDHIKNFPFDHSVRVYQNQINAGLGGSHKIAFRIADQENFTHLAVFHGDGQANVADLQRCIEIIRSGSCQNILGSRFMKGSSRVGYSKVRTLSNFCFNALMSLRTAKIVKDLGSGLNIFSVSSTITSNLVTLPNDLIFNISLLNLLLKNKSQIIWFPIGWHQEDQISNVRMLSQGLLTLKLILLPSQKTHKSNFETVRII